MKQYNFGSRKAVKHFLKNYSILLELKEKGNNDAIELLSDFDDILAKIKKTTVISQYIEIESGNIPMAEKIKYFERSTLDVISSRTRISREKIDELFDREIDKVVEINGKEDLKIEFLVYNCKDEDCPDCGGEQKFSEELVKLREIDSMLAEKIKCAKDNSTKKHLINMKKENYDRINAQYEIEGISPANYRKNNVKNNRVIYNDYVDNVPEVTLEYNPKVFEQVIEIAEQVLDVEEFKIFNLYYVINYTHREIAEIFDCKRETITQRLKKINNKLRKSVQL